ncbi:MAG: hypothetical protein ACREDS_06365 [Limisphaerales bacterium]
MKRFILILFFASVVFIAWFLLKSLNPSKNLPAVEGAKKNQLVLRSNIVSRIQMSAVQSQPAQSNVSPQEPLNAFTATSLNQWTNALPRLHRLNPSKYEEAWILEERNPNKHPSVLLVGKNGDNLNYLLDFVDIQVKPNGHIRQVELQTPFMDIDDIRDFGTQLCALLDINPNNFLAWCDKVGNQWVDQPIFYSGGGDSLSPGKTVAFNIRHTFNNEKPWYIDFVLSDK